MTKVLILYVEAGHGHRKVAEAIGAELKKQSSTDIQVEISDALKWTNRWFRKFYPQIYYHTVVYAPWLWGWFYYLTNLRLIYALIAPLRRLWNRLNSGALINYLTKQRFDLILFTHFFPAEVCATAKKNKLIDSALITVVTDVIPHAVWRNPGTDFYWVMTEESSDVLARWGVQRSQIYPKGIPVSSDFLSPNNTAALRHQFGLHSGILTLLFTSGSFGIGPTEEVLDSFRELENKIQVIVVCGNNKILFQSLNERRFPFPVILFGFVNNMHEIMSVSDLIIAKPGGATTCESLIKELPMVILSAIPGQESFNANWLLKHRAAFQIKKPREIKEIVLKILNEPNLIDSMRHSIKKIARPSATKDLVNFILSESEATPSP